MQIGSTGEEGLRDGNFEDAMFNRPQVMYLLLLAKIRVLLLA